MTLYWRPITIAMGDPGTDLSQETYDFLSLENGCSAQRLVFIFIFFLLVWIFETESSS